jgi:uncharacterized membrane protein YoaK (UPF0700 family)
VVGVASQEERPVTGIPAEPPIGGPLWTLVVPALLFVVAVAATVLLYRHFARRGANGRP